MVNNKENGVVISVSYWSIAPLKYFFCIFDSKGYGSIAHEAKPNGLLTRGLRAKGLIVLVSPN